jgi:phage terminase large subunit-like protein
VTEDPAAALLAAMKAASAHGEDHPLDWVDWTYPQQEFADLVRVSQLALFRAGNQIGKTWIGGGLTIEACLTARIEAWVVCTSWSQAVAIMAKVWHLVPKDRLKKGQRYSARSGFGKDNPALEFSNGSILRFRTTNQGAEALAGATVDFIWIDEPTDPEIYDELQRRIMRRGGKLIITLTPVNRDCTWLRKLVESGAIQEVHVALDARATTFARTGRRMRLDDAKRTIMDDAWIAEQIRIMPPMWAPVRLHGHWETQAEGVFYRCFDAAKHVTAALKWSVISKSARLRWMVGIDYAAADREYGQCASLVQVLETTRADGTYEVYAYIVDEVVMGGISDLEHFTGELLGMLARNGIEWHQVSSVHGDNPVSNRFETKSNLNVKRHVAQRTGVPIVALQPPILNAKDGAGGGKSGFDQGVRQVYAWFAQGRIRVHPRCSHTIKGLQSWDLSTDHPYKDICDAVRYALKPVIFRYAGVALQRAPAHVRTIG